MGFDWKTAVRGIAPALATALGGPAAGAATKALSRVLLGKEDATEDEIAARVESWTAADVLAVKQADQTFALEMAKIAQAADALEASDRANARAREIAIRDWVTPTLAIALTAIWALVMACLFFVSIPSGNRDVLVQGVGNASGLVGLVVGYYFGTSFGSRSKDAVIGQALNQ
jgi:hypothetical protein